MDDLGGQRASSDETDPGFTPKAFRRVKPAWRSADLQGFLWQLDVVRSRDRVPMIGHRSVVGPEHHARHPSDLQNPNSPAPPNLPQNCYDQKWLKTLNKYQLQKLNPKEQEYDFSLAKRRSQASSGDDRSNGQIPCAHVRAPPSGNLPSTAQGSGKERFRNQATPNSDGATRSLYNQSSQPSGSRHSSQWPSSNQFNPPHTRPNLPTSLNQEQDMATICEPQAGQKPPSSLQTTTRRTHDVSAPETSRSATFARARVDLGSEEFEDFSVEIDAAGMSDNED